MSDKSMLLTPVAEYLGVCVIERGGNVPKRWEGKTYTTNGFMYVIQKPEAGEKDIGLIKLKNEREVKAYIDQMDPQKRAKYMTMKDVWQVMRQPQSAVPLYEWDEETGHFRIAPEIKDGGRRTDSLKGFLE